MYTWAYKLNLPMSLSLTSDHNNNDWLIIVILILFITLITKPAVKGPTTSTVGRIISFSR